MPTSIHKIITKFSKTHGIKRYKIKSYRKIKISLISALTVSRIGYEFVIHVPYEYDYRFENRLV